ncbi:MAG TPA: rod shape-determining protein [Pyrinomonadaceae bacterium]|nr:rod shape-determining protein [Pyrinomonadaceae bacterium]
MLLKSAAIDNATTFADHSRGMGFMSKTAAFMGMGSLRELVSDSIAIDLGSAATIVYVRGGGVVVDQPSLVAVNNISGEVVAVGLEARAMYGREARDITVVAPLLNGVVADFERTREMLAYFVREARSGSSFFSRRALMSVYPGVTHVERRALMTAAEHARIGRVMMMDEGLAAAFGAGVKLDDVRATAVVDIGSGTTNVAVVGNGAIIHSRSERIGSADINTAIINHVRRHRGLAIGPPSAERLKIELASATLPDDLAREITVRGRDVVTGSPGAINITAGEIYPVAQYVVAKIVEGVSMTLAELSPEVAGDIYDRGIILTGGGALFEGIGDYMQQETKLSVQIADEPRYAIVRGLARMFDDPLLLRRVARTDTPPLLDESEAYSL